MADMSVLEVICILNKLRDRDLDHVKKKGILGLTIETPFDLLKPVL
ncbi:hypothetical protein [Ammoniphilus sp. 3BR4]